MLAGKGVIRAIDGVIRAGERVIQQVRIVSATSFQNEPKFNGFYSRHNFSKIKDGTYVLNLDEYESIRTHWLASYVNTNNVTNFDSFGVEHIPKEN